MAHAEILDEQGPAGLRLIADASVAVPWCAVSQASDLTWAIAEAAAAGEVFVPAHFFVEVASALRSLEQRNQLLPHRLDRFLADLAAIPLLVDEVPVAHRLPICLNLARGHGLTIYDAAYLELALRVGLPLATRDEPLAAAAASRGALFAL